jgi:glutaredoxin
MSITIYGKTQCQQCDTVKNFLDARGVPYEYKQLDRDFVREDVLQFGARSYPVIVTESGVLHGGVPALQTYLLAKESTAIFGGPSFLTE